MNFRWLWSLSGVAALVASSLALGQVPGGGPIGGGSGGGGTPSGPAGGDLGGSYPNPTVTSGLHLSGTLASGLTAPDLIVTGTNTGSDATPNLSLTPAWNTTGSPTALFLSVAASAWGASSKLIDAQFNSVSQFSVDTSGNTILNSLTLRGGGYLQWGTLAYLTSPSDGVLEVNTNEGGLGSIKVADVYTADAAAILHSSTTITGGGTGNTPTLTAGPVTGNPTKWLPYDDNGTTRYIPAW